MEEEYLKKIISVIVLIGLIVLSFFIIKPILVSILMGVILAIIFLPVYKWIYGKIKKKDFSVFIVFLILILIIIPPVWFLTPIALNESFKFFLAAQQVDFITPLKSIFPSVFASQQFSNEVGSILSSFVTKIINELLDFFSSLILNFPTIFLQFLVVCFTFYFVLRDSNLIVNYIKGLLPYSNEISKKLFESSKRITISIIYGQVVIGIIQGLIVGVSFFIFSVPNSFLLTILASLAGVMPIVGPSIIWVPVAIYFLVGGNSFAAFGITIFGLFSSVVEHLARPIFVSRMTKIHSSILLIGMIGGFLFFGILGIVIGPLILSYLLIILELYRDKKSPGLLVELPKEPTR